MAQGEKDGPSVGLDTKEAWWGDVPVDRARHSFHPLRWVIVGCLFLLPAYIPIFIELAKPPVTASNYVIGGLLVGYGALYVTFPSVQSPGPRWLMFAHPVTMLAIGSVLVLVTESPYILLYASLVVVFTLPAAWGLILDGGALLVIFAVSWLDGQFGQRLSDYITVTSITAAVFFMARLVRAVRRLEMANAEISTLAVAEERARLARDLHDVLGHSLTTITVKAGLARKILERGGDVQQAITEVREVEGLSRSALSDVRATVSDYREVSLSAEIVGARAALRAAEIDADLPHAVDNVEPSLQRPFGYVVREAVTNVIRHSGAKRAQIRLGRNWVEISDDGKAAGPVPSGNGLNGLTERLTGVGGSLTASAGPRGGFVVRAEVPLDAEPASAPSARVEPAGGFA
ncbi:sensor histidine kinase [Amycolatopsis minnesotensis]